MKNLVIAGLLAVSVGGAAVAQSAVAPAGAVLEQPGLLDEPSGPAGLSDLEKATFACPKAALNAAAREVASHPGQGTYQFSYFNIVSGSHHAAYEVHFTSNYAADPVLRFCVAIYCQQGFDPATTKADVTLLGTKAAAMTRGAGHAANACSPPRTPAGRRLRR